MTNLIIGAVVASIGLIICAASYGVAKIGKSALESMARQPEIAGKIRIFALLSMGVIDSLALVALVLCYTSV